MECVAERRVLHCRCHRMVSPDGRGRRAVAQGVTGVKHEREGCTIRQVEEFRASDQSGDCGQIPLSEGSNTVARERRLRVTTLMGGGDYVPMASRWRWGSRMMPPHSTQRTLLALCSSSETQSEIRRLCVQAQDGLIGSGCGARPDSPRFMVHLWDGK